MNQQLFKRKLATLFTRLDADQSGALEKTDMTKWADKLVSYGNIDADSEKNLRAKMDIMWNDFFASSDLDKSGSISFEEMCAYFDTTKPQSKKEVLESLMPLIFDAIDSDKSGSVTKTEFADYFKSLNIVDQDIADKVFESIDNNSDGTISKQEFSDFGKDFFTCEENDPASLLFGPLIN